jgi:predicted metal-binding protein
LAEARKFSYPVAEEVLLRDVEEYCTYAMELGATDGRVIRVSDIVLDPRVRLKCLYPKCRWYGTNAHCPPYALDLDEVKTIFAKYRYGILYRIQVPAEDFIGSYNNLQGKSRPAMRQTVNYKIASQVEARAFYDGYPFAVGFAGGPCKPVFCQNKECTAIIPGKGCSAPLKSRTSMEGVGINAIAMAVQSGWDIYPCGPNATGVPYGNTLGMVLID